MAEPKKNYHEKKQDQRFPCCGGNPQQTGHSYECNVVFLHIAKDPNK